MTPKSGTIDLDLLFMVDCTGSMAPYAKELSKNIESIVGTLSQTFNGADVRIAFLGYRDWTKEGTEPTDEAVRLEHLPFSSDIGAFTAHLKRMIKRFLLRGGYDHPEDVYGALEMVPGLGMRGLDTKQSWRNGAKVLIHCANAPGHGPQLQDPSCYPARYEDYHKDGQPDGRGGRRSYDYTGVLKEIATNKIAYFFFHCADDNFGFNTRTMVDYFNTLIPGYKVKDTDLRNPPDISEMIVDTLRKSTDDFRQMHGVVMH